MVATRHDVSGAEHAAEREEEDEEDDDARHRRIKTRQRTVNTSLEFLACYLLDALYFPVAMYTFQLLVCSRSHLFVTGAPYVSCGTERYAAYHALAWITVLVYLLWQPIATWCIVHRLRRAGVADGELRTSTKVVRAFARRQREVWGHYWAPLTRQYWWWKIVVHSVRKLALAAILTLIDAHSIYMPVATFSLLLLLVILQIHLRPFANPTQNVVDVGVLACACALYFTFILANADDSMRVVLAPSSVSGTFADVGGGGGGGGDDKDDEFSPRTSAAGSILELADWVQSAVSLVLVLCCIPLRKMARFIVHTWRRISGQQRFEEHQK